MPVRAWSRLCRGFYTPGTSQWLYASGTSQHQWLFAPGTLHNISE